MPFRFPGASDRVSIMGATGSGKTRFGVWLNAFPKGKFKARPNIFYDYKGDDLIGRIADEIPGVHEIDVRDKIPKAPGLYVVRPDADDPEIEEQLKRVHAKGNTGLFFDEGYMVPASPPRYKALNRILTQGRSLKIPVTILTQRPAWVTRFSRSEAGYFAIFRMQDRDDYNTVAGFVPRGNVFDFDVRLPEYHSRWYDVGQDWSAVIEPVPVDDEILDLYDTALRRTVRSI